ncbi:alpha/beta fold hydrolase [Massilia endophytica]|uniref:alpha/beta fold hydrolase n=1 Tax=Massilia endophytica TaxID=2899220 RepID=UPI001E44DD0A|nr:alpha/beta fold hydrolase [Massilia endophytica]UGQ47428.1 alpha/beta fold hydrolase [Massilia endophytica]
MPKQEIRLCTTPDHVRIAYAMSGNGPPLVKAANWLSHVEYDWESPVWNHLLTELSREHTLIRYDARGCGLSDRNPPGLSMRGWELDLETVVEAATPLSFPLIGISQGAALAVAYAVAHPHRVSRLVLSGGFARGRMKRQPDARQREEAELMIRMAELGWSRDNPAFRQFFTSQFIPGGSIEQQQWFNELLRISIDPAMAAQFLRVSNDIDVMDLLPLVQCPTLVLHAKDDARVPFDEGRLIASRIPNARFVPLESENHLLLEHEPAWRRWVQEIRTFLRSDEVGRPNRFAALTRRERDILALMCTGRDNAQIAASLNVSEKTVRNHNTSIYTKLQVENRAQATALATRSSARTPMQERSAA